MPLNVNLTPQLEKLVRRKVSSGRYNSASEVVREALRIMEAHDELQSLKLEQLRRDIRDGSDSSARSSLERGGNETRRPQAPRFPSFLSEVDAHRCRAPARPG